MTAALESARGCVHPTRIDMTIVEMLRLRQHNLLLLSGRAGSSVEVVRRLGAVQAQDYRGAKWGVAERIATPTTSSRLDALLWDGTILRTHVLRPTWHFVLPEDIRWMLGLTAPRIKAAARYNWRNLGLTDGVLRRAASIIETGVEGTRLTRSEISVLLDDGGVDSSQGRLSHILMYAELEGVICSGGLRGKQHTYAPLDERAPAAAPLAKSEALARLAARYFEGHGPATLHDFAWWSGLTVTDASHGIAGIEDRLERVEVEGKSYWFVPSGSPAARPTVHLLPNYDEYVVAYTDRTAVFDATHSKHLDSRGSPLVLHTIVRNGRIIGTWQAAAKNVARGTVPPVEWKLFVELAGREEALLAKAIKRYVDFADDQRTGPARGAD